jgi:hypothetical protein
MRKFLIYLDKQVMGEKPIEQTVEFDDDMTPEDIEEACADILNDMIGSNLDTGWHEVTG